MGLGWFVSTYPSHCIHSGNNSNYSIQKAKEVGPQSTKGVGYGHHKKGSVPMMQGDNFATEPGGIMEVAM